MTVEMDLHLNQVLLSILPISENYTDKIRFSKMIRSPASCA